MADEISCALLILSNLQEKEKCRIERIFLHARQKIWKFMKYSDFCKHGNFFSIYLSMALGKNVDVIFTKIVLRRRQCEQNHNFVRFQSVLWTRSRICRTRMFFGHYFVRNRIWSRILASTSKKLRKTLISTIY